jgi:hypothetical protein
MMTISSEKIPVMMVEHSQIQMKTTTITIVAKATMAVMEMLLMEEKNIAKNILQSILEMCIRNALFIRMRLMKK